MNNFHIVTQPEDWSARTDTMREQARAHLRATASASQLRNLETAAEHFQAPEGLLDAINAAIVTRSPLLLTGEPGTGKTQIAWFLKAYFGIELFEYQVRSDSQSVDLRYDFDAVAYLRDAYQSRHIDADTATTSDGDGADPRSQRKYLKPGVLWQAYDHQEECVLLLDEIDKAPRDFPNDVLQELDQHRFAHPFHEGKFVECQGSVPLTIITSNGERRLPDAFLRRCIVFHIELTQTLLRTIINAWSETRFPDLDETLRELALQRFMEIRNNQQLSKKPGAAELLLWLSVLAARNTTEAELQPDKLSQLPARVCLIKDHNDYDHLG